MWVYVAEMGNSYIYFSIKVRSHGTRSTHDVSDTGSCRAEVARWLLTELDLPSNHIYVRGYMAVIVPSLDGYHLCR